MSAMHLNLIALLILFVAFVIRPQDMGEVPRRIWRYFLYLVILCSISGILFCVYKIIEG